MTLTRAIASVFLAVAASIGLSLAVSAMADEPAPEPQVASVVWEERPDSLSDMASEASVVVEAEVVAIAKGPPLVAEKGDELAMPTQRIAFKTVETLEGDIADSFELFKTGSDDLYLDGDPLYQVGETYVLFLAPQGEPGTYIPVAPDGRLAVDSQGKAEPVIAGPVADEADGKSSEQIADAAGVEQPAEAAK